MNEYSILIAIGMGLGLGQVYRDAPRKQAAGWLNAALFTLLLALAGARAVYALQHAAYFRAHAAEILQIWLGGLSWPGAVLGGWFALILVSAVSRKPLTIFADRLALLVPPIAIAACLGSWASGIGYGPLASRGACCGLVSPDETGALALRWPLQPFAALGLLALFALIEWKFSQPVPAGRRAALTGLALALILLPFSLLAAEPGPMLRGYRLETWSAAALLGISLVLLIMVIGAKGKVTSGE